MRHVPDRRLKRWQSTAIGLSLYVGVVALGVAGVAVGVQVFLSSIFDAPTVVADSRGAETRRTAALMPTQDSWSDMVRDPAFWASRKVGGKSSASGGSFWKPQAPPPRVERASVSVFALPMKRERGDDTENGDDPTYRTVCVRLCDGAFFPLSFSTTRENFDKDAAKCEKSCGSESRMYFYKNPGAGPDDMEDMAGRPYKSLGTAFLYKTKYIEQCKCRAHPWEEASSDRHRVYALEAARAKGSKIAEAPLKDLKAKLRQAELDAEAEKKRIAQAKLDDQKRFAAEAKAARASARLSGPAQATIALARAPAPPARGLPPPASPEPTAAYQPPVSRPSTTTQSRPPKSQSGAAERTSAPQTVRPPLSQQAWKPQDLR